MWHEFKYSVYYTWSLLPYLFQNSYRFHIRYISLYNLTLPSASDESHENMLFQTIYNYTNNPDCHLFLEEIKHYLSFFKFIKRLKHYIHRSDVFTFLIDFLAAADKILTSLRIFPFFPVFISSEQIAKNCYWINFVGTGILMVCQLTLNLSVGNTCRLTFMESFEFVYAQFHEFCWSYHPWI